MSTYIFALPSPIKKLALLRQKEAGFIENENMPLQTFNFEGVFNWYNTPEGYDFWSNIDIKDYQCFKDKYGLMGEKLFKPENIIEPTQDFTDTIRSNWLLLSDDEKNIMGRPNFACARIAHRMRAMGFEVAEKAEAEQALVIWAMLEFYKKFGKDWSDKINEFLKNG